MRGWIAALVACLAPCAWAQPGASVPVLVIMLPHEGHRDPGAGLIGTWATSSVNKRSARKLEQFTRTLGTGDFSLRARKAFACFATTAACSSGPQFADEAEFAAAVRASPDKQGFALELLPELIGTQLLIRARAFHVRQANDVAGTPIRVGPGYHVLYTTRAPADVVARGKKNPAVLEAYWSDGEPRRIEVATQRGLAELNALLAMMIRHEGKTADPSPTLVSARDFPDTKRLACKGASLCGMTYVYQDRGDSFVLVHGPNFAGWLDAAAAANESNLPSMASLGVPR